jgi:hypothetical protein
MSAVGDPHPAASGIGELHLLVLEAPKSVGIIDVDPRTGRQADHEPVEGNLVFEADQLFSHRAKLV